MNFLNNLPPRAFTGLQFAGVQGCGVLRVNWLTTCFTTMPVSTAEIARPVLWHSAARMQQDAELDDHDDSETRDAR
jgi:hypothetical protein